MVAHPTSHLIMTKLTVHRLNTHVVTLVIIISTLRETLVPLLASKTTRASHSTSPENIRGALTVSTSQRSIVQRAIPIIVE